MTDPVPLMSDHVDDLRVDDLFAPSPTVRPRAPVSIDEAHARAEAEGAECWRCPLRGTRQGPVLDEIRPGSRALVLGLHPGDEEIARGRPMMGAVGRFVDEALPGGGLTRADVSIANVALCKYDVEPRLAHRRYKKRGLPTPVECCAPRLHRSIDASGAGTIIALGALALESVAGRYGIRVGKRKAKRGTERHPPLATLQDQRGHWYRLPDGRILLATYIPAYAMREMPHMLHVIREDIAMGARIAAREHAPDWSDPVALTEPSLAQVLAWLRDAHDHRCTIVVDIETAGIERDTPIRCIGMGWRPSPDARPNILVLPMLLYSGDQYWSPAEWAAIVLTLRAVLDDNPLEFAYGIFDTRILIRDGLMTRTDRTWDDLIVAHHCTRENDAKHKVAFISSRFLETPMWKDEVDFKGAVEED